MADPRQPLIAESKAGWPSGSKTVVMALSHPDYAPALGAAAALARSQNVPLLVADMDKANTEVIAELKRLATTNVILVGAGWSPKVGVRQEINAAVPTQEWISSPGSKEIASAVAAKFSSNSTEAYVAPVSSTGDVATAAAASAFQKSPLFLMDTSIDAAQVTQMKRLGVKTILMVGGGTSLDEASSTLLTNAEITFGEVTGDTVAKRNESVLNGLQNRNLNTRVISVASEGRPMDALFSVSTAARAGSIPLLTPKSAAPAAKVQEIATGWAAETQKITVLGPESELPASYQAALTTQGTTARAQPGELHVSSVAEDSTGGSVVSFSALKNATKYKVVDLKGVVVYEGTKLQFSVPSTDGTFLLQGLSSTGAVLSERDLRLTLDDSSSAIVDRVAISSEATKAHISWVEASNAPRPRKVIRSEMGVNPESGSIALVNKTVVAFTCGTSFTDTKRPSGKEVVYEIVQFGTPADNICSSASPSKANRATEENLTSARTPNMTTAKALAATADQAAPRAIPTVGEQALLAKAEQAVAADGARGVQAAAVYPWTFRYQTFIQADRVRPVPGNQQVFKGDNRNYAAAWSDQYRTRVDLTYEFSSPNVISRVIPNVDVGETVEYKCTMTLYICRDTVAKRTQAKDGVKFSGTNNRMTVNHALKIPFGISGAFGAPAPAINVDFTVFYGAGGFTVMGRHDGAPAHELWGGWVPGEYVEYYSTGEVCGFFFGLSGFCNQAISVKI